MKRKKSPFKIVIAVVILAVIALIGVVVGIAYKDYSFEKNYVATVGGEKITVPEFRFFLTLVKNNYETQAGVDIKDEDARKAFWKTKSEGETAEDKAKNQTLDQLKEFKILLIKAKEKKVELGKEDLDKVKTEIDKIIEEDGKGNKSAASAEIKKKYGVSLAKYESIYKNYMLAYGKFAKDETSKNLPNDKDLKDYFDKNKNRFGDAKINLIKIDITDPSTKTTLTEDKLIDKKSMAEDVLGRVEAGGDFATLAKQYSDHESKDNGGAVTISKDDTSYDQKIRDWALSAKAGEIKRIDTADGYYILKYDKKILFEDMKDTVKLDYQQTEFDKKVEEWKKDEKYNIVKNQTILKEIKLS